MVRPRSGFAFASDRRFTLIDSDAMCGGTRISNVILQLRGYLTNTLIGQVLNTRLLAVEQLYPLTVSCPFSMHR